MNKRITYTVTDTDGRRATIPARSSSEAARAYVRRTLGRESTAYATDTDGSCFAAFVWAGNAWTRSGLYISVEVA
jgi:hypothetical protein